MFLFAHGAGAGIHHTFMEQMSAALVEYGISTLRYHFPYMEAGRKRPDSTPRLIQTVVGAYDYARREFSDVPLLAGGKSMGGRMTSHAAALGQLPGVRGLIFFGFPLHPAGKPGTERADHLSSVRQRMIFLQGTRDKLADLSLLRPICDRLRATLSIYEGVDHSFRFPKNSPYSISSLAKDVRDWMSSSNP